MTMTRIGSRVLLGVVALLAVTRGAQGQLLPDAKKPPAPALVFQPLLIWKNAESTQQGTGFFADAGERGIVAVSSAHFLNFDGPPLVGAAWLDVASGSIVGVFNSSVGAPGTGTAGTLDQPDLSVDYLIMPAPGTPKEHVLTFDSREAPDVGERVWLPNKDPNSPSGFVRAEGRVTRVGDKHIAIELDKPVRLQSQSGSPFISIKTGHVIAVLAAADEDGGKQIILAAPIRYYRQAIAKATDTPALQSVIGKAPKSPTTAPTR